MTQTCQHGGVLMVRKPVILQLPPHADHAGPMCNSGHGEGCHAITKLDVIKRFFQVSARKAVARLPASELVGGSW